MSNDSLKGFSNIIGFLILQKSNVNFISKSKIESTALQVLAEVFFQSTDLRDKWNFKSLS